MYTKLNASRSYVYAVAKACDQGKVSRRVSTAIVPLIELPADRRCYRHLRKDCAGAILYSSDRAVEVTMEAMQMLGGNGYINGMCPRLSPDHLLTPAHALRISHRPVPPRCASVHSGRRHAGNQENAHRARIQRGVQAHVRLRSAASTARFNLIILVCYHLTSHVQRILHGPIVGRLDTGLLTLAKAREHTTMYYSMHYCSVPHVQLIAETYYVCT